MSDKEKQSLNHPPLIQWRTGSGQAFLDRQFKNLRVALMFLFPIVTLIAFKTPDILFFLPKEISKSSILSLQIIIWAVIFICYNLSLTVMAWFLDRKQVFVSTIIIGLISFLPFYLYFVPRYGSAGLSTTVLIVLAIMFAFMAFSFAKIGVTIPVYKSCEKPVVASMGMTLVLHYTDSLGFAVAVSAAAISYVLILFVTTFLEK